MINQDFARSCKESLVILNELNLLEKIPNTLLEDMRNRQDNSWNFVYDRTVPLESQKLLKDTAELLSVIYLKYICENDNEKQLLRKIYEENDICNQGIQIQEYSKDKKEITLENKKTSKDVNLTNVLTVSGTKLKDKILKFFRKIFKK